MPLFTITLTDAQAAAITRCLTGSAYKTPETWLKAQAATWAQQCVTSCRDEDLRKVGVSGLSDLTAAELKAIMDARKGL